MQTKVYWITSDGVGRLGIMPRPRHEDWLEDEIRYLREAGVDVLVSLLSEQEALELDLLDEGPVCALHGIEFISFPICDRHVPPDTHQATRLIAELNAKLLDGKSVVLHCRFGVGRSSMMAASLLAAAGVPVKEAFERIGVARGQSVPDNPDQYSWVEIFAANRLTNQAHKA